MSSTLSHDVLLELMAYADGELDDDARARIEGVLRESDEARAVVAAMDPLGEFVRTSAETGAQAADGIANAVMARIEADSAHDVIATTRAANDAGGGELERARARRAARNRVFAAAAAVAALAAGYFVMARPAAPNGEAVAVETPSTPTASAALPREAPSTATVAVLDTPQTAGVEVEHVDAPNNDVSVIYVPAVATPDVNASSVVIWINDDKVAGGL